MKSYLAKNDEVSKKWSLMDANGEILGRFAVKIAIILRGKNKPTYTPHIDTGDFVIVVNAEKIKLTGNKEEDKVYQDYSGYMGGRKTYSAAEIRASHPDRLIRDAVRRMMPRNRLARQQLKKLKIYTGEKHSHEAQKPQPVSENIYTQ